MKECVWLLSGSFFVSQESSDTPPLVFPGLSSEYEDSEGFRTSLACGAFELEGFSS